MQSRTPPPSRPPPIKHAPERPPLPPREGSNKKKPISQEGTHKKDSASSHNDAFIEPSSVDDHRRSMGLPNSPFYTPSQDLLGLDQSLFHEIGSNLSEDTRSILSLTTAGASPGDPTTSSGNNPFAFSSQTSSQISLTNPFSTSPTTRQEQSQQTLTSSERNMDLVFDADYAPPQQHELHRSPVLTRATSALMSSNTKKSSDTRGEGASSSTEFDPFASCFEDAKKDFRLTDKR